MIKGKKMNLAWAWHLTTFLISNTNSTLKELYDSMRSRVIYTRKRIKHIRVRQGINSIASEG
jgi:hypothetical protein